MQRRAVKDCSQNISGMFGFRLIVRAFKKLDCCRAKSAALVDSLCMLRDVRVVT